MYVFIRQSVICPCHPSYTYACYTTDSGLQRWKFALLTKNYECLWMAKLAWNMSASFFAAILLSHVLMPLSSRQLKEIRTNYIALLCIIYVLFMYDKFAGQDLHWTSWWAVITGAIVYCRRRSFFVSPFFSLLFLCSSFNFLLLASFPRCTVRVLKFSTRCNYARNHI